MKSHCERKIRAKIEQNVEKLPEKLTLMLQEYDLSKKHGFSEMVKKVGKILMLYLEGLYCDRLITDERLEQNISHYTQY